ncbi:hypothetical protein NE237_033269 [Protea cynaroides]|uniref:SURP motif domain-containing protein n=1 Tax=Protea cynaroides TaxID=273540 RepID=A0A9Q0L4R5_9MAGN|nr:hypothetical protein NE237_033269 [Protea cynaroides]
MDRQAHDYATTEAMAFTQQQQQQAANIQQQQPFGFHPQHQQYPQQMHVFPSHIPPHHVPSPYLGAFDSAPPPIAPPSDLELHKCIDKLVEYAAKNGLEFEAMIREKQKDNPAYSFLFGAEGHDYYHYKLWLSLHPSGAPFNLPFHPSSIPFMPPNPMMNPAPLNPHFLNAPAAATVASASMLGAPQLHHHSFPPFYDQQQQHPQHLMGPHSFKGLSEPLPSDVGAELNNVLNNLSGTKESIKALADVLKDRVLALDDFERQLHIIYLANDILFDSLAFKAVIGTMLARVYHNPHNKEANQSRLQKILQFWALKEVYDPETLYGLESEMLNGPPSSSFFGLPNESAISADPSNSISSLDQEQADKQASTTTMPSSMQSSQFAPPTTQQYLTSTVPAGIYSSVMTIPLMGSLPISVQPSNQPLPLNLLPTSTANVGEKLPPYPLFPPGLIPGMVKKMQIGSGVPYSPMSPLDIPTVIPPSIISPSEILERVSRFFKEIREVNPSEGPMNPPSDSNDDYDEYEREPPVRKGGACIPPPPNLQVDTEAGTFADGSIKQKPEHKGSGRLGLGASAIPNEVSQYDNVYTSYRK